MRFCKDHWDKLRTAIKNRGLDHLGAKTTEQLHADMVDQLRGSQTDYDPLMDCYWMISNRAIEMGGLYMMTVKENGEHYCPVCEAIEKGGQTEQYWIDGPADAALKHAQKKGLVPKIQ